MTRESAESPAAGSPIERIHGGPDARGPVRWDFSTNVNATGPCPQAVQALARADSTRYPDPSYEALRQRIAAWHDASPESIVFGASASELIQRITAVGARLAPGPVEIPAMAYGDYAAAAHACIRHVCVIHGGASTLRWCTDPGSPLGQAAEPPDRPGDRPTVLDAAYAPLRISGATRWTREARDAVIQLYSPNKALGLPGIRGAYAILPSHADWPVTPWRHALAAAAPSWPLGAHAVALLDCWIDPATQTWMAESVVRLTRWTAALRAGLDRLGLKPLPSVTPFLCATLPAAADRGALRARGLAVRDTASFGMPGSMRVSAQPPDALAALFAALHDLRDA